MINVIIADDDDIFRNGLKIIIEQDKDIKSYYNNHLTNPFLINRLSFEEHIYIKGTLHLAASHLS